ncbi:competence protein ComK [Lysinibacillus sp. BPa_S21]|uniref:competence protein ComK n=1 Tax=Lysinibacillus sp. BPa_S21 TaxID=2932478 RepID=UPI0020115D8A|nr:competence protein ComK [Lysinibacillus sp. BPa_S21]MCL1695807.1 competence protein ComK [Lysinibacillus sp. BPa_S21]
MHSDDIMSSETMLYIPEFDAQGNLYTRVIERHYEYVSKLAPTKLIDYNLRYFGSSLRGAFDGSRMILGKLNQNPIVVHEQSSIIWFPSKSYVRPECKWFAVHHIKDYQAVDKKNTKVTFLNGYEDCVDLSIRSFENRVQRAFLLKYKLEKRTKNLLVQFDQGKVFQRVANNVIFEDEAEKG